MTPLIPSAIEALIDEATQGDESARQWLRAVVAFAHLLDDLWDRDVSRMPEEVHDVLATLGAQMAGPFWLRYREILLAGWLMAVAGWTYHELTPPPTTEVDRGQRAVIRSSYYDLILLVAYLVRGAPAARELDRQYRGYST